jgi:hypothetical protein
MICQTLLEVSSENKGTRYLHKWIQDEKIF